MSSCRILSSTVSAGVPASGSAQMLRLAPVMSLGSQTRKTSWPRVLSVVAVWHHQSQAELEPPTCHFHVILEIKISFSWELDAASVFWPGISRSTSQPLTKALPCVSHRAREQLTCLSRNPKCAASGAYVRRCRPQFFSGCCCQKQHLHVMKKACCQPN